MTKLPLKFCGIRMAEPSNIHVVIRPRPTSSTMHSILQTDTNSHKVSVTIFDSLRRRQEVKTFQFDHLLSENSSQDDVFGAIRGDAITARFFRGFSNTVLAYGQTSTGKTWTIDGGNNSDLDLSQQGIVPRFIHQLFLHRASTDTLSFSFFQIYNDRIYDLLSKDPDSELRIRNQGSNFMLENLTVTPCDSELAMMRVYKRGRRNKTTASHALNDNSSRSHSIIRISLTNHAAGWTSALHVVDLAGCERMDSTEISTGTLLRESNSINTSLFVLRKVITAVANKELMVPFRESKLTSVLKESIGGNSYTVMIACISPNHLQDTLSTLQYAQIAGRIENAPVISFDPKVAMVEELRAKLDKCYAYIEEKTGNVPRWLKDGEKPNGDILTMTDIKRAIAFDVLRTKQTHGANTG